MEGNSRVQLGGGLRLVALEGVELGLQTVLMSGAGPERVTITPISETRPSALGISLETSYASKQLSYLMTKIANSTVAIPVRLQLETDPYNLKQMIEEAVREAMDVRVR